MIRGYAGSAGFLWNLAEYSDTKGILPRSRRRRPVGRFWAVTNPETQIHTMTKSTRLIITAAAIAGLYAGALTAGAYAQEAGTPAQSESKEKASCKGKEGCKAKESCKGKEGCKAKESCKGKEGCKAKESCKGKEGCKAKESCTAKEEAKK